MGDATDAGGTAVTDAAKAAATDGSTVALAPVTHPSRTPHGHRYGRVIRNTSSASSSCSSVSSPRST